MLQVREPVVALFLLCLSLSSVGAVTISAGGSSLAYPLYDAWLFSYALTPVGVSVNTNFDPIGSGAALRAIAASTLDWAASDTAVPATTNAATYPPNDILQFPTAAAPLVLIYNLPYGGLMDRTNASSQLVLDGPTIAGIFARNITNWRHPAILALQNSAVASLLPNASIELVLRSDAAGTTTVVQQCLNSFSKNAGLIWPYGAASLTWSAAYRAAPHTTAVVENAGVALNVGCKQNSIGYVALSAVVKSTVHRYAAMKNANGQVMRSPELASVFSDPSSIASFNLSSQYISTALYNSPLPNAWPIAAATYAMFRQSNYSAASCEKRREIMLFWNWALTNELERERMISIGFISLGDQLIEKVLNSMRSTLLCPETKESLLAIQGVEQHTPSSAFTAVLITNCVMAVVVCAMFISYISRDFSRVARSAMIFLVILFIGGMLNYVSVIFFYLVPSSKYVCQGRLWFAVLGFSAQFSALACRGYQIYSVANLARDIKRNVRHTLIAVVGNCVVLFTQLIILILWSVIDPFTAVLTNIDPLRLTSEWICASQRPLLWWGIEVAFTALLLLVCLGIAYITWDLKHMVKESKWMSISIYNSAVVLCISLALYSGGVGNDNTIFWVTGCAVFLLNTSILLAMFLPKVFDRFVKGEGSHSDTTGSTSRPHSGSTTEKKGTVNQTTKSEVSQYVASNRRGNESVSSRSPRNVKPTSKFGSNYNDNDPPQSRSRRNSGGSPRNSTFLPSLQPESPPAGRPRAASLSGPSALPVVVPVAVAEPTGFGGCELQIVLPAEPTVEISVE